MRSFRNCLTAVAIVATAFAIMSSTANAQKREFTFAYDQPKTSGYGAGAEMFNKKLMDL